MKTLIKDSQGMALLIVTFVVTMLLTMTGASLFFARLDLKKTSHHRTGSLAFYIADAGISHAFQKLADGDGINDFGTVSSTAGPTTLLSNTGFGSGSYTVVAELVPGSSPKRVKVKSTGCVPAATGAGSCLSGNAQVVLESQFKQISVPLPGSITLIGDSADFTGGQSNAKLLSGDEASGCGLTPSKPVVAVTDGASKASVQMAINNSKPGTYVTAYAGGKTDDIVASGEVNNIKNTYGFDYTNVNDLKLLVAIIEKKADYVVQSGGTPPSLGSVGDEKLVVADGDLTLGPGSGAGILVVKGNLTLHGNVSYRGVILVIGTGVMTRFGGGNGAITGGTLVAKVVGPDGIYGTADDALGPGPMFDTSGGGNSDYRYCSSAVNDAFSKLILMLSWNQAF